MGSPFKMNPKTPLMKALVGKQGNLPQQLQDAIKAAPESPARSYGKSPAKKTTDPKKKKDKFRYESDMPGVTGTTYTKDTRETASDYKRKGEGAKIGQKTSDPSFEPGQKPTVTKNYRDKAGRKSAGTTGKIEVEIKKGSTRFTTDKEKSKGKSPVKKTEPTQKMKNIRSKTKTSSGEKRMSNTPSSSRRKVYTKGKSSPDQVSYIKKEKSVSAIKPKGVAKTKKSIGKSPAKMKGVKALKKK
jgi:hypothetical protein